MKKLYFIFLLVCFTTGIVLTTLSQNVNPLLYSNTWLDNETRTFEGYEITKIFGQLPDNPTTYNFAPITAVLYTDSSHVDSSRNKSPGGQLLIYLTRYDEERANLKWYFIILRDMDDKTKIWEYDLPYQFPQNPTHNGWWNYKEVNIPVDLPDSFYIYLNDKRSRYLSDFKFLVEKIKTK